MTLPSANTHVFILRIWREERVAKEGIPIWRGVIEHIPQGERRYVDSLDEIETFIEPFCRQLIELE